MKHIIKDVEPDVLTGYKLNSTNPSYINFCKKSQRKLNLNDALLDEQGYLCCYCMGEINSENMQIEHWKPQSKYPKLDLDYNNLFACCEGNKHNPKRKKGSKNIHCDSKKSSLELTINPLNKDCETEISYFGDGTINAKNSVYNKDINDYLNLNYENLKRNRKSAWIKVLSNLTKNRVKNNEINKLINVFSEKNKDGKYHPYCQIIVFFLKKRQVAGT